MDGETPQKRPLLAPGMGGEGGPRPRCRRTMGARRRLRQVVVLCALAAGLLVVFVGPARAAQTQESLFQDDSLLVFGSPSQVARTMDTLRFLGVDRVRVTVFWNLVAPSPASRKRPSFDATNPAAYPPSAWRIYDTIVRLPPPPRPGGCVPGRGGVPPPAR